MAGPEVELSGPAGAGAAGGEGGEGGAGNRTSVRGTGDFSRGSFLDDDERKCPFIVFLCVIVFVRFMLD